MSESAGDKVAECAFVAVGVAVVLAIGATIRGLVLTKLWSWFIVTTFGLHELSVGQAIGLGIVVCFIRPVDLSDVKKKDDYSIGVSLAVDLLLTPLLVLTFGKVVHVFLM